jgi:hypothetical protein
MSMSRPQACEVGFERTNVFAAKEFLDADWRPGLGPGLSSRRWDILFGHLFHGGELNRKLFAAQAQENAIVRRGYRTVLHIEPLCNLQIGQGITDDRTVPTPQ